MRGLTAERLRELLSYDPATGEFLRLATPRNASKAGDVAGCVVDGYRRISVDGRQYQGHRLAWLHAHGRWPADQIDHVNGIRDDNRLCNLREATNAENLQNLTARSNSRSGLLGVSWHARAGKWMGQITHNRKLHYLGLFATAEEAHVAYLEAKAKLHTFQPVPLAFQASEDIEVAA